MHLIDQDPWFSASIGLRIWPDIARYISKEDCFAGRTLCLIKLNINYTSNLPGMFIILYGGNLNSKMQSEIGFVTEVEGRDPIYYF
jgi:hypothetical protein